MWDAKYFRNYIFGRQLTVESDHKVPVFLFKGYNNKKQTSFNWLTRGRDRIFPFKFGGKNWGYRIPFKTTNQNPTNETPTVPANTWSCHFRNRRGTRAEGNSGETTAEGQRETNLNVDREWVPYVNFHHRVAKMNVRSSSSKLLPLGPNVD